MLELNKENFDELTAGEVPVVVDFYATWCKPCLNLMRIMPRLEEQYTDDQVLFASVDVDQNPEIAAKFSIASVPTFLVFRKNEILTRWSGAKPLADIKDSIDSCLGITKV